MSDPESPPEPLRPDPRLEDPITITVAFPGELKLEIKTRKGYQSYRIFSRVHATLQPALSVRRSVRPSVRPSVTLYFFVL